MARLVRISPRTACSWGDPIGRVCLSSWSIVLGMAPRLCVVRTIVKRYTGPELETVAEIRPRLFDGNRLGEVSGLIHVAAPTDRHVIGEQLERDAGQNGGEQIQCFGNGKRR